MNDPIRIMIIEDNEHYLNSLLNAFEEFDELKCIGDYASFEIFLKTAPESPDCILLDINLPGLSGLDALPRIKQLLPHTNIIMLTQYDDYPSVLKAIRRGAAGYIIKDGTIKEIHQAILDVHNGAAVIDPRLSRIVLTTLAGSNSSESDDELHLSTREMEVLNGLADGLTKKEVADTLALSYHTIDSYTRKILDKLKSPNAAAAIATAIRKGLI